MVRGLAEAKTCGNSCASRGFFLTGDLSASVKFTYNTCLVEKSPCPASEVPKKLALRRENRRQGSPDASSPGGWAPALRTAFAVSRPGAWILIRGECDIMWVTRSTAITVKKPCSTIMETFN
jgi:hypothetical protein